MASSTRRPTPRASPPRVKTFRLRLLKYRRMKAQTMEMGMERETIRVLRRLRRKIRITSTARAAPMSASCCRFVMELRM